MAHAAPRASSRHLDSLKSLHTSTWAVPVVLGIIYGFWASNIHRQAAAVTVANFVFGLVCFVAFTALMITTGRLGQVLPRELHAAAYGAFAGIAAGFLKSLTNESVLRSAWVGVVVGVGVGAFSFYRFYTREK
ncbi:hypothetical protein [Streptomyces sp. NPDC006879]|uniref:hypothetical protein n=1 Tax=Streptomyces sp. NPDC006879 TaxID=3364767 RepID=UPI0036C06EDB